MNENEIQMRCNNSMGTSLSPHRTNLESSTTTGAHHGDRGGSEHVQSRNSSGKEHAPRSHVQAVVTVDHAVPDLPALVKVKSVTRTSHCKINVCDFAVSSPPEHSAR